jgi:hypothetical protein
MLLLYIYNVLVLHEVLLLERKFCHTERCIVMVSLYRSYMRFEFHVHVECCELYEIMYSSLDYVQKLYLLSFSLTSILPHFYQSKYN